MVGNAPAALCGIACPPHLTQSGALRLHGDPPLILAAVPTASGPGEPATTAASPLGKSQTPTVGGRSGTAAVSSRIASKGYRPIRLGGYPGKDPM
jgi:hypothetical protein